MDRLQTKNGLTMETKQLVRVLPPMGYTALAAEWDDIPEMTRVSNRDAEFVMGHADTEEMEFQRNWEAPEFDHKRDTQLILDGTTDRIVGFVQIFNEQVPATRPYIWNRMLPGYHNHAAGDFLLYWAEKHCIANLATIPGDLRVVMNTYSVSGFEPLEQLLKRHGYKAYYDRGMQAVALGVDAQSLTGATRLYERAGMHVHPSYDRYEKVIRNGKEIAKMELG